MRKETDTTQGKMLVIPADEMFCEWGGGGGGRGEKRDLLDTTQG